MSDKFKLKFGWPMPVIKDSTLPPWYVAKGAIIVPAVGTLSKIWLMWLNNTRVHNVSTLNHWVGDRAPDQPLLTICNHHSCFDEPLIHGVLSWSILYTPSLMRWSLAAHDVVFTKRITSWFFSHGKCVPVVRGIGVNQKGLDFCTDRLREGKWVHIFPEGKVNAKYEYLRFKWGIGRMVYDCWKGDYEPNSTNIEMGTYNSNLKAPSLQSVHCSTLSNSPNLPGRVPVVIPIYHSGMDSILPNKYPYIPLIGKKVTILVGEPINLESVIARIDHQKVNRETARKMITDHIQQEFNKLREKAEELHSQHLQS